MSAVCDARHTNREHPLTAIVPPRRLCSAPEVNPAPTRNRNMRAAILAATMLCGLATGARADVVYTFTTTSFSYVGPGPSPQQPGLPLQASIVLTNAAVASGSFQLVGSFNSPNQPQNVPLFTTNSGGLVSLNIQGVTATPTSLFGSINLSLGFDNAGQITSSSIRALGFSDGVAVSGPGSNVSGFVGSDNSRCNADISQQVCAVSGFFTEAGFVAATASAVPEPASVALLGLGIAAFGAVRRRSGAGRVA